METGIVVAAREGQRRLGALPIPPPLSSSLPPRTSPNTATSSTAPGRPSATPTSTTPPRPSAPLALSCHEACPHPPSPRPARQRAPARTHSRSRRTASSVARLNEDVQEDISEWIWTQRPAQVDRLLIVSPPACAAQSLNRSKDPAPSGSAASGSAAPQANGKKDKTSTTPSPSTSTASPANPPPPAGAAPPAPTTAQGVPPSNPYSGDRPGSGFVTTGQQGKGAAQAPAIVVSADIVRVISRLARYDGGPRGPWP